MTLAYQFKPHERPVIPGSPFNPDHPKSRMWAYGAMGVLAALTGGLGNALVTTNLAYFQGTLGLASREVALRTDQIAAPAYRHRGALDVRVTPISEASSPS